MRWRLRGAGAGAGGPERDDHVGCDDLLLQERRLAAHALPVPHEREAGGGEEQRGGRREDVHRHLREERHVAEDAVPAAEVDVAGRRGRGVGQN